MNIKLVFVLAILHQTHATWDGSCDIRDTVDISGGSKDTKGNYLFNGTIYSSGDYGDSSVDASENNIGNHTRGCICKYKSCIRSCDGSHPMNVFNLRTPTGDIQVNITNFEMLKGGACKYGNYYLNPDEEDEEFKKYPWQLFGNGSFFYENFLVNFNEYCFNFDGYNATVLMCFTEQDDDTRNKWNIAGLVISIPFLIATLYIYASIKELNSNLHGKCLMCYMISLIVLFLCLLINKLYPSLLDDSKGFCTFIAYMFYFSFLITFAWLNIMSYDIWKSHSVFQHGITILPKKEEQKRFFRYCLFGYGCPTLIMLLICLIDITKILKDKYLPGLGKEACFIQNEFAEGIYLYTPMGVVMVVNCVFYALTAINIWWTQHFRQYVRIEQEKANYLIYLQLFIIMGITWIMEIISWLFSVEHPIFNFFDFLNCVQGFIIFLICVCNSRVRNLIKSKWCLSINTNGGVANVNVGETTIGTQ